MMWIVCILILCVTATGEQEGLYKSNEYISILNENNFYQTVLGKENAWFIEFYNVWCGHCVKFAPVWKELARDTKDWYTVVQTGAVNCADDVNRDLCREYNVQGYPTLRLFPPHAKRNEMGLSMSLYGGGDSMYNIRRNLVKELATNHLITQQPSWPILSPIKNVDDIWNDPDINNKKFIVLLAEYNGSYMGSEAILDFSGYPEIWIRRILNEDATKIGITTFPSLILMKKDGTFNIIGKGVQDRKDIDRVLYQLIDETGQPLETKSSDTYGHIMEADNVDSDDEEVPSASRTSDADHMQDLESALHYSFRQEIAIHKIIDGEALQALKDFIRILAKYFPGRDVVKHYLWRLDLWIKDVTTSLTGETWLDKTVSEQNKDAFLPEIISWTACHGSKPKYRGYPCSMWMLFHTLTVSAYNSGKDSPHFNPKEVLHAIKGYMTNFFGCEECSRNFLKMADSISEEVSLPEDSVLWLWRAHNKANKRLHGDESEDPTHPKIQFPSSNICPTCCTTGEDGVELRFDESEVLKFLVQFYADKIVHDEKIKVYQENSDAKHKDANSELDWWERKQRRRDLEKIKDLHRRKREKNLLLRDTIQGGNIFKKKGVERFEEMEVPRGVMFGWGFNKIDLGMCVLFYVMCTVIILLVYYHFMIRRNMKPCNILPF